MGQIKVTKCPIEGLYVIEPTVHGDARGYFMETYNQRDMEEAGLNMVFVQDNQSLFSKYHLIVFFIPSANLVSGNQPSSLCILVGSMAYLIS